MNQGAPASSRFHHVEDTGETPVLLDGKDGGETLVFFDGKKRETHRELETFEVVLFRGREG